MPQLSSIKCSNGEAPDNVEWKTLFCTIGRMQYDNKACFERLVHPMENLDIMKWNANSNLILAQSKPKDRMKRQVKTGLEI